MSQEGKEGGTGEGKELEPASQLNDQESSLHISYLNSSDISTFELEEDYDGGDGDG